MAPTLSKIEPVPIVPATEIIRATYAAGVRPRVRVAEGGRQLVRVEKLGKVRLKARSTTGAPVKGGQFRVVLSLMPPRPSASAARSDAPACPRV